LLENYGLADRADHRPEQLSGGQRQRVAIARATSMHPTVLLADEPTGNLDQTTGKEVMNLLEQLVAQQVTLIVVTHDPAIGGRATRQVRMVDGQIVSDTRRMPDFDIMLGVALKSPLTPLRKRGAGGICRCIRTGLMQ